MLKPPRLILPLLLLVACSPDAPPDAPDTPPADSTLFDPVVPPDSGVVTDTTSTGPMASEGTRPGSCDLRASEHLCYAFTGLSWTPESAETECSGAIGGTYGPATCPTAERIGECVYQPGGDAEREVTYTFYAPTEPFLAEARCNGVYRAF